MTKTNVQLTPSIPQHHDTPNNKTHIIKFRVTAEEKASLELACATQTRSHPKPCSWFAPNGANSNGVSCFT